MPGAAPRQGQTPIGRRGFLLGAAGALAPALALAQGNMPDRPPGLGGLRETRLQIATDDTNSPYYAVGTALSALVKMRVDPELGIGMYARASLGSWDNGHLLRAGKADFAIMQALFGLWAREGRGVFNRQGPDHSLRAVASLWPDVEHVMLAKRRAATGTIEDLRNLDGSSFAVGPRGSGIEGNVHLLMRRLDIDPATSLQAVNLGPTEAASAMLMGTIAGMTLPGGPPISLIEAIISHDAASVKLLEFTDRQLRLIDQGDGLWRRHVIPPGTYLGQEASIQSIAQPAFLAVRAQTPADVVYAVTKAMFENLDILRVGHRAANAISLDTALGGLPAPLHPGALRFYREASVAVPPALEPPA